MMQTANKIIASTENVS